FFANYTNRTSGAAITGAACTINFSDNSTEFNAMTYNVTSELYEYNRSFSTATSYTYTINCTSNDFENLSASDSITISSTLSAPILMQLAQVQISSPIQVYGYTNETGVNVTVFAQQPTQPIYRNYTDALNETTFGGSGLTTSANISSNIINLNAYPDPDHYLEFAGHNRSTLKYYGVDSVNAYPGYWELTLSEELEQAVESGEVVIGYNRSTPNGWFNLSLDLHGGSNLIYARTNDSLGNEVLSETQNIILDQDAPTIDVSNIPNRTKLATPTVSFTVSDDGVVNASSVYLHVYNTTDNISVHINDTNGDLDILSYFEGTGYSNPSNITCSGNRTDQSCSVTLNLADGYYNLSIYIADTVPRTNYTEIFNFQVSANSGNMSYVGFENSLTTNFSQLFEDELANITNVTIGLPGYGLINYTTNYLNLTNINISDVAFISENSINVRSTTSNKLNHSAILTLYNLSFQRTPIVLMDGQFCNDHCDIISYTSNNLMFNVSHFTTYIAGVNSQLTVYDENDAEGGSLNRQAGQQTKFFANYSNRTSNVSIATASCTINFSDASSTFNAMTYNATSELYEYNRSFATAAIYTYTINCTDATFEPLNTSDSIEIYTGLSTPFIITQPTLVTNSTLTVYGYTNETGVNLSIYTMADEVTYRLNSTTSLSSTGVLQSTTLNRSNITSSQIVVEDDLSAHVHEYMAFRDHDRANLQYYEITGVTQYGLPSNGLYNVSLSPELEEEVSIDPITQGVLYVLNNSGPPGWFNVSIELYNGTNTLFARTTRLVGDDYADSAEQIIYLDYQSPTISINMLEQYITYEPNITIKISDDGELNMTQMVVVITTGGVNHSAHFTNNTTLNRTDYEDAGYNTSTSNITCSGNETNQSCYVSLNLFEDGGYNVIAVAGDTAGSYSFLGDSTIISYVDPSTFGVWDTQCNESGWCEEDEFNAEGLFFNWSIGNPYALSNYSYTLGSAPHPQYGYNAYVEWTNLTVNKTLFVFTQNTTLTNFTRTPMGVYYLSIKGVNNSGHDITNTYSSNGIIFIDLTPPTCAGGTPCVYDSGEYAGGFESDNGILDAYWTFEDNESGILNYNYALGTTTYPLPGYNSLAFGLQTDTNVTEYNLTVVNNQTYYWSVRAKNYQNLESDWMSSDGIVVDTVPPYGGWINYTTGTHSSTNISLDIFSGTDQISGINNTRLDARRYQLNDGECQSAILLTGIATPSIATREYIVNVNDGFCYEFSYRVYDAAGNYRDYELASPVKYAKVDSTPPSSVVVSDINYPATTNPTGYYTDMGTQLFANWTAAEDLDTQVFAYQYIITEGGPLGAHDSVITPLVTVNATQRSVTHTGLLLDDGTWYYINVRAVNGAGRTGEFNSSDGIYYVDGSIPTVSIYSFDNDTNLSNGYLDSVNDNITNITVYANEVIECLWSQYDIDYDEDFGTPCENTFAGNFYNVSTNITVVNTTADPDTYYDITINVTNYNATPVSVCNISLTEQGNYTRYIVCRDSRGNEQLMEQNLGVSFTVDWPEPPTIYSLNFTPATIFTNSTVTCNGTSGDNDGNSTIALKTITLQINGTDPHYSINSAALSLDLSEEGHGNRGDNITCIFDVTDQTNRTTTQNITINISNINPNPFIILSPNTTYVNTEYNFTWNATSDLDNDGIDYFIWISNASSSFFAENLSLVNHSTNETFAGLNNTVGNLSNLPEQTVYWYITACDNSSQPFNCTNSTNVLNFTIDRTGPTINITNPQVNETLGGLIYIRAAIEDTNTAINNATYQIVNASNHSIVFTSGTLTESSGYYIYSLTNTSNITEGLVAVVINSSDALGNTNSEYRNFTLNNSQATTTIINPNYGSNFFNSNFFMNLTATALVNMSYTITNSLGAIVQQNTSNYSALEAIESFYELVNVSELGEGVFTINFTASSYVSNDTETMPFYIDLTPPQYSSQTYTPAAIYDDTNVTLYINWSNDFITDAGLNRYELETIIISHNASGSWANTTVYSSNEQFSLTITDTALSNGEVVGWRSYATDFSNNTNVSELQSFTVQNRPPVFSGADETALLTTNTLGSDIYENLIVYSALNVTTNTYDIFMFNISNNETTLVHNSSNDLISPKISFNLITYYDLNESDVYLYYISNESRTTISEQGTHPDTFLNKVVFVGLNNISIFQTSTENVTTLINLSSDTHIESLSVSGDYFTYSEINSSNSSDSYDAYLFEIPSLTTTAIATSIANETQTSLSSTDASYLFDNGSISRIYYYNLSSSSSTLVDEHTHDTQRVLDFPLTENGLIMWRTYNSTTNYTTYYYNISTKVFYKLTDAGDSKRPRGFNGQYFLLEGSLDYVDKNSVVKEISIPEDQTFTINISGMFTEQDDDNLAYSVLKMPRGTILYDGLDNSTTLQLFNGTISYNSSEYSIINNTAYAAGQFGNALLVEGPTTNLLSNPSFETGTTDPTSWTKSAAPTYVTGESSTAKDTNDSIRVNTVNYYAQTITVAGETTYTLSEYILLNSSSSGRALIQVIWYNDDAFISTNYRSNCAVIDGEECPLITDTQNYTRHHVTVTSPSNANSAKIILTSLNNTYIKADAVQFEEKSYPTTYTESTRGAVNISYPMPSDYDEERGTVQFWFKLVSNLTSGSSNTLFDLSNEDQYIKVDRQDSTISIIVKDDESTNMLSTGIGVLNTELFNLLTLTWQPNNISLYYNGTLMNTTSVNVSPESSRILLGSDRDYLTYAGAYFDDLAIFDYALTPNEVSTYYNNGKSNYSLNSNMSINISTNQTSGLVTVSATENHIGSANARFVASDGTVSATSETITFTYYDLNDAPIINFSSLIINVLEDSSNTSTNLSSYVSDPESSDDDLNWLCTVNNTNITIAASNATKMLSVTSGYNFNGFANITCTVFDPLAETDTGNILVNVTAVNDDPVLNLSSSGLNNTEINANASTLINLSLYVVDVEDTAANINWTCTANTSNVTASASNTTKILNITGYNDYTGYATINCTAHDTDASTVEQSFQVSFVPPVDLSGPVITFNNPTNNSATNTTPLTINISTDEQANCTMYLNSTDTTYNLTSADNLTHTYTSVTRSTDDEYHTINISCIDHAENNNTANSSISFRMMVDYIIVHYFNSTPTLLANSSNITLNATLTSNNNLSTTYATVDFPSGFSQNVTLNTPDLTNIIAQSNNTITIFTNTTEIGRHNVTLYVNDTQSNTTTATAHFTTFNAITQVVNILN
ncbi:hypothetical protein HOB76_03900, partial [Candidatus Woesearchaeota archaeon]|nr:hypothetical protein [Candidatus Woesearchaeota archaeon]